MACIITEAHTILSSEMFNRNGVLIDIFGKNDILVGKEFI